VRYVALLRGINVGGNHMIAMPALRACVEGARLRDVTTYIQSGNVLFEAGALRPAALATRLERALESTFGFPVPVVVRSADEMRAIVADAPKGFGTKPDAYRYDVLFLKGPLAAADALEGVPAKPGVDRVWAGDEVLYYSRVIARATESRLNRVVGTPIYRQMTIRNWNTTTKLAGLLA
jgi:uncharacterized protein (DUF1697 family)